jgi:hypothetical protein
MWLKPEPEKTHFGLVLPPSQDELEYLRLFRKPKRKQDTVSRHHIYFPRKTYVSPLEIEFREHDFNSIWILDSDHISLHKRYKYVCPPEKDVMEAFLDEAAILEEAGVCMRALEMIDAAIYEGRIKHLPKTQEDRLHKLETVAASKELVNDFEIIPLFMAHSVLSQLAVLEKAS